jgi:hypothetical protein
LRIDILYHPLEGELLDDFTVHARRATELTPKQSQVVIETGRKSINGHI